MCAVVQCIRNKVKSSTVIIQAIQVNQNEDGLSNLHNSNQIPMRNQENEEDHLENRPKACETDSITKNENDLHHSFSSGSRTNFEDNAAENTLNCEIKSHQGHIIEENKEGEIKFIDGNQD